MLHSMTGYGKTVCELENKKVTIEIKSLNSKQLDLNMRLPGIYREKEMSLRNKISKQLQRGKIDIGFYVEITGAGSAGIINRDVVKEYHKQLSEIQDELGIETDPGLMQSIIRLPEVFDTQREELDEEEWNQISREFENALGQLIEFRNSEGMAMEKDILLRIGIIENLLNEVSPFESERIEKIRTRLDENLKEYLNGQSIDENRLEQEIIFYLEKIDITEEKVRLANHCEYFREVAAERNSIGKKLGFISQEIGREINTLGSKANNHDIQKIVVRMKDELEKIKEQLLNVL
ncbi:MAG: YicC/YloC family endoribonuclease [Bacteroidota bacterium]|nr:YicC/YloC family endoribonuclease [Bacteroidota bacterium]